MVENFRVYSKYLDELRQKVDICDYIDYASVLTTKMFSLGVMENSDAEFIDEARKVLIAVKEYSNLGYSYYLKGEQPQDNFLSVFVSLGSSLEKILQRAYEIADEDLSVEIADEISDTINEIGTGIIIQDTAHWTTLAKMFCPEKADEIANKINIAISNNTLDALDDISLEEREIELMKAILSEIKRRNKTEISIAWVQKTLRIGWARASIMTEKLGQLGYISNEKAVARKVLKIDWEN